jgi:hypothetical protein
MDCSKIQNVNNFSVLLCSVLFEVMTCCFWDYVMVLFVIFVYETFTIFYRPGLCSNSKCNKCFVFRKSIVPQQREHNLKEHIVNHYLLINWNKYISISQFLSVHFSINMNALLLSWINFMETVRGVVTWWFPWLLL